MLSRDVSLVLALAAALLPAAARAQAPARCSVTDRTYAVAGSLEVSGTPGGRADGTFGIGPGTVVLRFQDRDEVKMLGLQMSETITARFKQDLTSGVLTTTATSTATPDACGVVAVGRLEGDVIHWETPLRGYRTDGLVQCWGASCDTFGIPSQGQTPLHVGPAPQQLSDFVLSKDKKTFTMARTPSATIETPQQTWALSLSGTQTSYGCSVVPPCTP